MPLDNVVFWVFAPISVASAIAMLFQRNAVHAALFLIVNFFTIAVFYLVLGASFLFAVQIIVYAGAIMVLFLFVIMLLGVDRDETLIERLKGQRPMAIAARRRDRRSSCSSRSVRASGSRRRPPAGFDEAVNAAGTPRRWPRVLFRDYFFPFEVTSILLIVAAIAVMVLASRQAPAITRAEQATAAAAEGRATEPAP